MPKGANQKKKLVLILELLKTKSDEEHPISVQKIVSSLESCGVSSERKSIYSDIDTLIELGYDIIHEGKKGYYLASREFQLPELMLLCDAVASSRFITPKKSDELIEKLKKLTSEEQAKNLSRQVVVANRIKTMNESIYYSIDDIHRAIAKRKKIEFLYFDFDENKNRVYHNNGEKYVVDPLSLLWEDDNYYLIAYDCEAKKIKHYRADKTESINILDSPLCTDVQKDFNISEYSSKLFSMFGGKEEPVWLVCKNSFAGKIIDRFGKDLPFIKEGEDSFKVRVKVMVSPMFFAWVFGMGGNVKISGPKDTVSAFREYIKKISKDYDIQPS